MGSEEDTPQSQPSAPWRAAATFVMGVTGTLFRGLMYGANRPEVHGLDQFLQVLDGRKDVEKRERGLITGMPHISFAQAKTNEICSLEPHQCVRTYHLNRNASRNEAGPD